MWNPPNLSLYANLFSGKLYSFKICTFFSHQQKTSPKSQAPSEHPCFSYTHNVVLILKLEITNSSFFLFSFIFRWDDFYACRSNIRYIEKYSQRMIGPCVPNAAQKMNFRINPNGKTLYHKMEYSFDNELVAMQDHWMS